MIFKFIKFRNQLKFLLVIFSFCFNNYLFAQTVGDFQTRSGIPANSAWTDVIWQRYNGTAWVDVGVYPTASDGNVTILAGASISIGATAQTCSNIIINGTLTLGGGAALTSTNNIVVNNTLSVTNSNLTATNGSISGSSQLTVNGGLANVYTNAISVSNLTLISNPKIFVKGNWNVGFFNPDLSTVSFVNSTPVTVQSNYSFHNLTINTNASVTLASDLTVKGLLTLSVGTFYLNGFKLSFTSTSTLSYSSGMINGNNTGTVVFNGPLMAFRSQNLFGVVIQGGANITLENQLTLADNGYLDLNDGTLDRSTNTISFGNGSTIKRTSNGSLLGTGTINFGANINWVYYGVGSIMAMNVIEPSVLYNVTVNDGAVVMLDQDSQITNNLDMMNGEFDINGKTLTISGTITYSGGFLSSNLSSNLVFNNSPSTSLNLSGYLNNLTINSPGQNISMISDVTVYNILNLSNGSFLIQNHTLTVAEISYGSGSLIGGTTSNLTFQNSAVAQSINVATLNDLTIDASGIDFLLSNNLTISGTLNLINGNLDLGGKHLSIGSNFLYTNGYLIGNVASNLTILTGSNIILRFQSGFETLNDFTIQNSSTNVSLESDLSVYGQLNVTEGTLTVGVNWLNLYKPFLGTNLNTDSNSNLGLYGSFDYILPITSIGVLNIETPLPNKVSLGANLAISNELRINAGCAFDFDNHDLTFYGILSISGSLLNTTGNGSLIFYNTITSYLSIDKVKNLYINDRNVMMKSNITVNGVLALNSGSLDFTDMTSAKTLTVNGDLINTSGVIKSNDNTTIIINTPFKTIYLPLDPTYNIVSELQIKSSADVTLIDGMTAYNMLNIEDGCKLRIGTGTLIIHGNLFYNISGEIIGDVTSSLIIEGTYPGGQLPVSLTELFTFVVDIGSNNVSVKNLSVESAIDLTSGSLTVMNGTLTLKGTINKTAGNIYFSNGSFDVQNSGSLTIPSTVTTLTNFTITDRDITLVGNLAVNQDLTLNSGSLILAAGYTLEIGTNIVQFGGEIVGNTTSSIHYKGSVTNDLLLATPGNIGSLIIDGGGTLQMAADVIVNGTLDLNNGNISIVNRFLTLKGGIAPIIGGSIIGGPSASLILNGAYNYPLSCNELYALDIQLNSISNNVTIQNNLTCYSNLSINKGTLIIDANKTLTLNGDLNINLADGALSPDATSNISINNFGAAISLPPIAQLNKLSISDRDVTLNGNITLNVLEQNFSNLTINNKIIDVNTINQNSATLIGSFNSVLIIGDGTQQNLNVNQLNKITVKNNSKIVLTGNLSVENIIDLTNGQLDIGANLLVISQNVINDINLLSSNLSSLQVSYIASDVNIPSGINELKDFLIKTGPYKAVMQRDLIVYGKLDLINSGLSFTGKKIVIQGGYFNVGTGFLIGDNLSVIEIYKADYDDIPVTIIPPVEVNTLKISCDGDPSLTYVVNSGTVNIHNLLVLEGKFDNTGWILGMMNNASIIIDKSPAAAGQVGFLVGNPPSPSGNLNLVYKTTTQTGIEVVSYPQLYNFVIENTALVTTKTAVEPSGILNLNDGILLIDNATVTIHGQLSYTTGKFSTINNGAITFEGAFSYNLPLYDNDKVVLNVMTPSIDNTVSLLGDITLIGNSNVTSGALIIGANTLTVEGWTCTASSNIIGSSLSNIIIVTNTSTAIPASINELFNLTVKDDVTCGSSPCTNASLNGNLVVYQNLYLESGNLSIGANTLTINDMIVQTSGTLTGGLTSSMIFNSPNYHNLNIESNSLYSLEIKNAGTVALTGDFTIGDAGAGPLKLTDGTLDIGPNTLILNGGIPISGIGTLTGNIDAIVKLYGYERYRLPLDIVKDLYVDCSSDSVYLDNDCNIQGSLNLVNGRFAIDDHTLAIDNYAVINTTSGELRGGYNSNLIYNSTSDVLLPGITNGLNDFTVYGPGKISLNGNLYIYGNFDLQNGSFAINGQTLTLAGTFYQGSGLFSGGPTSNLNFFCVPNAFPYTMEIGELNNLNVGNSVNHPEIQLSNSMIIYGNLEVTNGKFYVKEYILTIYNNIVYGANPENFIATDISSLIFSGSSAAINMPPSVKQLNTLIIDNTFGSVLFGNLEIVNLLDLKQGVFDIKGYTLYINNGTITKTTGMLFSVTPGSTILYNRDIGSGDLPSCSIDNLIIRGASGDVNITGNVTVKKKIELYANINNTASNNITLVDAATIIKDKGNFSYVPNFGTGHTLIYMCNNTTGNEVPTNPNGLGNLKVGLGLLNVTIPLTVVESVYIEHPFNYANNTIELNNDMTIGKDLIIDHGAFNANDYVVNLSGNLVSINGAFNQGTTGILYFSGNGDSRIQTKSVISEMITNSTALNVYSKTSMNSTISFSDYEINKVEVLDVNYSGAFDNDLKMSLIHPGSTSVYLFNNNITGNAITNAGFSDDGFGTVEMGSEPYSDLFYLIEDNFYKFKGLMSGGNWNLNVDNSGLNDGVLQSWSLKVYYTIPSSSTLTFENVVVNKSSGNVYLDCNAIVYGELNLASTSQFIVGANTLTLNMPLVGTLNNLIADNTSSIEIAGTVAGINLPMSINNLKRFRIDNVNGSTLQGSLTIENVLELYNGKLFINDQNVIFKPIAVIDNGGAWNNNNYIVTDGLGYVQQELLLSQLKLFPVGSSISYTPLQLTLTGGSTNNYRVSVYPDVTVNGAQGSTTVTDIENWVKNTWYISQDIVSAASVTATFTWNVCDQGMNFDNTKCYVSHFTGAEWDKSSVLASSGSDPYSFTKTGISSFSPFSLKSCIPPNTTLTVLGSFVCDAGNGTVVVNSAEAGYTYRAYISATLIDTQVGTGSDLFISIPNASLVNGSNFVTITAEDGTCGQVNLDNQAIVFKSTSSSPPLNALADHISFCDGAFPTLTLSYSGGSLGYDAIAKWYNDASCLPVNQIATGNNQSIVAPIANTSYFVRFEGACTVTTSTNVNITVFPQPTATATDKPTCNGTIMLDGNDPLVYGSEYSGIWTQDGSSLISNHTLYNSNVTGIPNESTINYTWTISGNGCTSDITIQGINNGFFISAGSNQIICQNSTTLAGTQPMSGTGLWTKTMGFGSIENATLYNTVVQNVTGGGNSFNWTIWKNGCNNSANVIVNNNSFTIASGSEQNICSNSTSITGEDPGIGVGYWTRIYGSGILSNSVSMTTSVSDINTAVGVFRWTVERNGCTAYADFPVYNISVATPTILSPTNTEVCVNSVTLVVSPLKLGETGYWTQTIGFGSISTYTNTTLNVSSLTSGMNHFIWTVEHTRGGTTCINNAQTDIFNNTVSSTAVCNGGAIICSSNTSLTGNDPSLQGASSAFWTNVSGTSAVLSNSLIYNPIVTNIPVGINSFTWTIEKGGCSEVSPVVSFSNNSFTAGAGADAFSCENASYMLNGDNPSPGTGIWIQTSGTGTISNPSLRNAIISGISATIPNIYYWEVHKNGCIASSSVLITGLKMSVEPTSADVSANNYCAGSVSNLTLLYNGGTIGEGAVAKWYQSIPPVGWIGDGSPTIAAPSVSTAYYVRFEGTCGNTGYKNINVNVYPIPIVTISSSDASICVNGTRALTGNQVGGVFSILGTSTGSGSITGDILTATASGTLDIQYSYSNGTCSNTATQSILVYTQPVVSITSSGSDLCLNHTRTLTGNQALGVFSILNTSTGSGTISGSNLLTPTRDGRLDIQYYYTDGACSNSATQSFYINPLPVINFAAVSNLCINSSSIDLVATPSGGIFGGNGVTGNSFDPLLSGIGSFTLNYKYTDVNGCTNSATRPISVFDLPVVSFACDKTGNVACMNDLVTFSANGGTYYKFMLDGDISGVQEGANNTYATTALKDQQKVSVYVKDNNGCSSESMPILMTIHPLPVYEISQDTIVYIGTKARLYATYDANYQYNWTPPFNLDNPSIQNPIATLLETTKFNLIVTNQYNCTVSKSVTITVDPSIFVYNAFTPNGDGRNDVWYIRSIEFYPNNNVKLLDRGNNIVFETNFYKNDWDGKRTNSDDYLPAGTYFYIINLGDGSPMHTGYITIIR